MKKKSSSFPIWLTIVVPIILMLAITLVYFYPVLEGKKIYAGDTVNYRGASKEIVDYRDKTGEEALWTNSMFGGMPAYQISTIYKMNLMRYIDKVFKFGFKTPVGQVIMYFFGFYLLLLVMRVNPWLSLAGALAFAFSSYFFIILEAGHNSKASAIGYMAPVLAGVIMTYRGRYWLGGAITAFFLALEILMGHPQITYYLLIIILLYGVAEFISHIREKTLSVYFKASAVLIIAGILGVLTNTANLWGTYEYTKYSIRGKSELTHNEENATSGLDKDYATAWSYGIPETMTLLIPDFQGGSSHSSLSKNSETYKVLKQNRIPNADKIIASLPMYWGPQPFTSGPVYIGAVIFFLFILSLFVLKGPIKWWGLVVVILSVILAWGKNFMAVTNFFLDHVPWYNKFRTVSMILVMAELVMPLMAILGISKILSGEVERKQAIRYLKSSTIIVGSILVFFILFGPTLFSFSSPDDAQLGLPDWLLSAIRDDRKSMLRTDSIRSLIFVLMTAGVIWGWMANKIKKGYLYAALPLLILIDMWPVDKRYLNNEDFTRESAVEKPFTMTRADQAILQDKDLDYRVYNMTEAFDKSARTSYFHKNIGGYHGAKMRRFQELVDFHLAPERSKLVKVLSNNPTQQRIDSVLRTLDVFNMLNTRYFIYNNDAEPIRNPYACGNAWFVKNYELVENADQEIAALGSFDPDSTAVIDRRFFSMLEGFESPDGPGGDIRLIKYAPNHLVYEYSASLPRMAIFSEIYYDKGWDAFIDGQASPYFRADYALRGMILPKGEHRLEFIFEPRSYYTGEKISLISSGLIIVLLGLAGIFSIRKMRANKEK